MCYCHHQEARHACLADAPRSLMRSFRQQLWWSACCVPGLSLSQPQRSALGTGAGAEGMEPPAGEQWTSAVNVRVLEGEELPGKTDGRSGSGGVSVGGLQCLSKRGRGSLTERMGGWRFARGEGSYQRGPGAQQPSAKEVTGGPGWRRGHGVWGQRGKVVRPVPWWAHPLPRACSGIHTCSTFLFHSNSLKAFLIVITWGEGGCPWHLGSPTPHGAQPPPQKVGTSVVLRLTSCSAVTQFIRPVFCAFEGFIEEKHDDVLGRGCRSRRPGWTDL